MSAITRFEDIQVWKLARKLTRKIYELGALLTITKR